MTQLLDIETWLKTSSSGGGRKPPFGLIAMPEPDDDIKALGDEIANLTLKQAEELARYVAEQRNKSD